MPRPPRADVAGELYHVLNRGNGHLYQGRFKSFPIQGDEHFYVVCRYVKRNALAAGLVAAAEDWRFGSLYNWQGGKCGVSLSSWPIPRLLNWVERVNRPMSEKED